MLSDLVLCGACGNPLAFFDDGVRRCCNLPYGSVLRSGFIVHDSSRGSFQPLEMIERDHDAFNYLSHPKFPTQVERLRRFLGAKSKKENGGIILDLGCGPGPTTGLLLDAGYEVVAVDMSLQSLAVNAQLCRGRSEHVLYVQADLNAVEFVQQAFDGLMMADFLQHIGSKEVQATFLRKIFSALKPGGWFYLSFFNTNIVDLLRGDLEGNRGNIPFRRLSLREARCMLPHGVSVNSESVMNVFHSFLLDRVATSLPIAPWFARMAVIEGNQTGQS